MNLLLRPAAWAAMAWLIIATVLFCLPGSALPSVGWFSTLQVDKWIHVGIFFLLCALWCVALRLSRPRQVGILVLVLFVYGCLIEWVQHSFIVNRSFDVWDIVADTAGAVAARVWWGYIKK